MTRKNMIRFLMTLVTLLCLGAAPVSAQDLAPNNNGMIVRIAEIEVYPQYLEEYLTFSREVARESVAKEKGVVSIYPMSVAKDNTQVRILEIYRDEKAYKHHITTAHFKKYKEGTLHMVKNLNLLDTYQICPENFEKIFKKAK